MSDHHEQLKQEVDKIDSKMIIGVGAVALVIFGLGIVWAINIQKDSAGTLLSYTEEQKDIPIRDEVGMVYQTAFDKDFAAKLAAEHQAHLDSVGWVDQAAKKAHIPIAEAMKAYVAKAEQSGGKL